MNEHGPDDKGGCCGMGAGGRHGGMMHGRGPIKALLMLALLAWVALLARNTAKNYRYIGVPVTQPHTINVAGEGKVNVVPDVALVSLGMTIEKPTVGAAQQENTRVMNAIIAKLADMGVDKKDIQTSNYNLNPQYDWTDNKQRLRGYGVSQSVTVKVRALDKVGDIIGAAGDLGANQVGGISFTVDNPESIKEKAREMALTQAKSKAEALAKIMGVELVRVVSFDESGSNPPPQPMYYAKTMDAGMAVAESAPSIQAGSTDVIVNANVTYEIR